MSLEPFADNPYILTVISVITIMGGLGFYVWTDLLEYRKTKKITFLTKLILISEAVLFILGGLYFTISEWGNPATFGDFPAWQKITNGFFYSVTTRSAGFFTVPEAGLTNDSTMLGIAWMFIGCAPGSTGGGIKTTTFAIIAVTIWCVIRGKSDTLLFGRRVDKDLVYKAFSIMMLSAMIIAVTTLVILNTNPPEKIGALDAAFEATSAYGTCGIPTGLEASLSVPSRLALCLTMLIGRVGPVTFAASLAIRQSKINKNTTYPEAKIVVG
jgi:trk system potassium uptake protein TrkH